ncbi:unnamed protein product [Cuscuta campestris]|uniref:Uncharacterized protein n=1 Tax=Cuscuta campestris TaxID=132261 RepID=A0A484M8P8_9ASTE|nr:unnamed protein product [Cuscuta campestris]
METSPPPTDKTKMRGKNRRMLLVSAAAAATQRNRRPNAAVDAPEERKKPKERKQGKSKWPFKKTPEIKSRKEEKITAKSGENNRGKSKPPAHFLFLTVSKRRRRGWGLRLSGGGLLLRRWKRRVGCALRKWMSRGRRSLVGWAPTRRPRGGGDPEIQRLMRNEEDEEEEGIELCKKRILMGDKCKALSQSGRLHYDENGVLLPEMIPYE